MKKTVIVLLGCVAFVSMSFGLVNDEPRYKNLKVLPKNISKPQLDSVMKHFTVALGVKCTFCHEQNAETKAFDFVTDKNKHKIIARDMMKMTAKLNKKYFHESAKTPIASNLEVTCFTCHNGKAHPAKFPAPKPQATDSTKKS